MAFYQGDVVVLGNDRQRFLYLHSLCSFYGVPHVHYVSDPIELASQIIVQRRDIAHSEANVGLIVDCLSLSSVSRGVSANTENMEEPAIMRYVKAILVAAQYSSVSSVLYIASSFNSVSRLSITNLSEHVLLNNEHSAYCKALEQLLFGRQPAPTSASQRQPAPASANQRQPAPTSASQRQPAPDFC